MRMRRTRSHLTALTGLGKMGAHCRAEPWMLSRIFKSHRCVLSDVGFAAGPSTVSTDADMH